jgi:hypothetical protein
VVQTRSPSFHISISFFFQKVYHRSTMEDDVLSWKTLGEEGSEQFAFLGSY